MVLLLYSKHISNNFRIYPNFMNKNLYIKANLIFENRINTLFSTLRLKSYGNTIFGNYRIILEFITLLIFKLIALNLKISLILIVIFTKPYLLYSNIYDNKILMVLILMFRKPFRNYFRITDS